MQLSRTKQLTSMHRPPPSPILGGGPPKRSEGGDPEGACLRLTGLSRRPMLVALVLHGCLAAEQHTCGTTAVPGILGTHGLAACCPASCGECGGKGCQSRPGGKEACCAGAIRSSARTCDRHAPPCLPWPAAHHETWQPAPGFVGLPHAPGASRVESRKGKRRFGPVLGCASFETPN